MVSTRWTFVVLVATFTSCGTGASNVDRHKSAARKRRVLAAERSDLRGPTQQAQQLQDAAWQPAFLAALNSQVHSSVNKGDSGNGTQHAGSGGGKEGGKQKVGPVSVQVPEKDISELMLQFSDGCKHRMNDQLEGTGTELHTFGGPTGGNVSKASCNALNGTICDTHAQVVQIRDMPNDRHMHQTVDVTGKGCLPSECMSASDLEALSRFMHGQAKNQVPGMGVTVELNVDCTNSGGHSVLIKDQSKAGSVRGGKSLATTHWSHRSAIAAALLAVVLHP